MYYLPRAGFGSARPVTLTYTIHRKADAERATVAGSGSHAEGATVRPHDLLGDEEPQAQATGVRLTIALHLIEALKDVFDLFGRNPHPAILDLDLGLGLHLPQADVDVLGAGSVTDGVVHQVQQDLLEAQWIDEDHRRLVVVRESEELALCLRLRDGDGLLHQVL